MSPPWLKPESRGVGSLGPHPKRRDAARKELERIDVLDRLELVMITHRTGGVASDTTQEDRGAWMAEMYRPDEVPAFP